MKDTQRVKEINFIDSRSATKADRKAISDYFRTRETKKNNDDSKLNNHRFGLI